MAAAAPPTSFVGGQLGRRRLLRGAAGRSDSSAAAACWVASWLALEQPGQLDSKVGEVLAHPDVAKEAPLPPEAEAMPKRPQQATSKHHCSRSESTQEASATGPDIEPTEPRAHLRTWRPLTVGAASPRRARSTSAHCADVHPLDAASGASIRLPACLRAAREPRPSGAQPALAVQTQPVQRDLIPRADISTHASQDS